MEIERISRVLREGRRVWRWEFRSREDEEGWEGRVEDGRRRGGAETLKREVVVGEGTWRERRKAKGRKKWLQHGREQGRSKEGEEAKVELNVEGLTPRISSPPPLHISSFLPSLLRLSISLVDRS